MSGVRILLLAIAVFPCGCESRRITPEILFHGQLGALCTVQIVADLSSGEPCDLVRSMLPPLGNCGLRQVSAADSLPVLSDYLLGHGIDEASTQNLYALYQRRRTAPLPGSLVEILETNQKEYCRSATSWTDVKKRGENIIIRDLIPAPDLSSQERSIEILYISTKEMTTLAMSPGAPVSRLHRATPIKTVHIYLRAVGAFGLPDAGRITQDLVSRLDLAQYNTYIGISNHPWFFPDGDFPLSDPLIYSGPISREDALGTGAISCLAGPPSGSCTGPFGQSNVSLDGH